jgi:hypothetical protein
MRHTRSSRDWYFGEPLVLRVAEASEPGGDGAVTVTVEGPGQLGLSYQLQGLSTGELVALGEADSSGAGSSPSRSVQIWTRACTGWGWPGTATRSPSSSTTP